MFPEPDPIVLGLQHEEAPALREAGARCTQARGQDAITDVDRHRTGLVVADHSTSAQYLGKLHWPTLAQLLVAQPALGAGYADHDLVVFGPDGGRAPSCKVRGSPAGARRLLRLCKPGALKGPFSATNRSNTPTEDSVMSAPKTHSLAAV